jgi:hypothetical protein
LEEKTTDEMEVATKANEERKTKTSQKIKITYDFPKDLNMRLTSFIGTSPPLH